MTEVLFSSENQQYAVSYRRVVSVAIYVIPIEAKLQSVYTLLLYITLEQVFRISLNMLRYWWYYYLFRLIFNENQSLVKITV